MQTDINKIIHLSMAILCLIVLVFTPAVMASEELVEPTEIANPGTADVENPQPAEVQEEIPARNMTLTGTVNEFYQLVTDDGTVYYIGEGEVGDELVAKIGSRVSASGNIIEDQGDKIIFVSSYRLISKE